MVRDRPPDVRYAGIEQFHHPRPVSWGGRPTPVRERLLSGVSGFVLELGAGDGVKFLLYPPEVLEITVVEPDPASRETGREGSGGVTYLSGSSRAPTSGSRFPRGPSTCWSVPWSCQSLDETLGRLAHRHDPLL